MLGLARLAPGLVDCSPSLAARLEEKPAPTPDALREQAVRAREQADRWTAAQLAGIETACEALAGTRIPYRELVERCYGVTFTEVADEQFEAAHERLAEILPGRGTVRERYAAWLDTQRVPPDRVLPATRALADALGSRARERYGLPEGEGVDVEVVHGELWFAFASYQGDLRSSIRINTELPIHAFELLDLVAHEIYPGHHTEHILKEDLFHAFAYPTPQALVSEGIAMIALEQLLGDEAHAVGAACLRPLGIGYDEDVAAEVAAAQLQLLPVRANLAMRMDEGRADAESALAYARRWLLEPDPYAQKIVQRMQAEPWPPYESCYPEGMALCRAFCAREDGGFRRLLTEPLTPGDVSSRTIG